MEVKDILIKELVVFDLEVMIKEVVIEEMVEMLDEYGILVDKVIYVWVVLDCEVYLIIGIGNNIVILYGKSESVIKLVIVFVRMKEMIEWELLDDELVNMIFLLVIIDFDKIDGYLKIFVEIVMKLMDDDIVENLKNIRDEEEVI